VVIDNQDPKIRLPRSSKPFTSSIVKLYKNKIILFDMK
jgi:hypothetical protein